MLHHYPSVPLGNLLTDTGVSLSLLCTNSSSNCLEACFAPLSEDCEVKLPAFHTLLSPARSAPTPSAHPNPVYSVRQISRQVSGIPLGTQGISSQPPLQYSALPVLESFSSAQNISLHFSNLFSFHPYILYCHILRAGEHGGEVYRSWSGVR